MVIPLTKKHCARVSELITKYWKEFRNLASQRGRVRPQSKSCSFPTESASPVVGWINRGSRQFTPAPLSLPNCGRQLNSMTVPAWRQVQEKLLLKCGEIHFLDGNPLVNAKILFGAENPPGSRYISGSQDHIGLLNPGISRLYYEGEYWPSQIDSTRDKDICDWLSNILHLIPLEPRPVGYDPLKVKNLTIDNVQELGDAGEQCWKSILRKDAAGLGESMTKTFLAWKKMLPYTVPDYVMKEMEREIFP
jgi:hypothetical protein